jgi:hypothetical protein
MAQYKTKQGVSKSLNMCRWPMHTQKLRNGSPPSCQLPAEWGAKQYTIGARQRRIWGEGCAHTAHAAGSSKLNLSQQLKTKLESSGSITFVSSLVSDELYTEPSAGHSKCLNSWGTALVGGTSDEAWGAAPSLVGIVGVAPAGTTRPMPAAARLNAHLRCGGA